MATYSSILAWRILWTGGLQSIRSQRVDMAEHAHRPRHGLRELSGCCGRDCQLSIPIATPKTLPCCLPLLQHLDTLSIHFSDSLSAKSGHLTWFYPIRYKQKSPEELMKTTLLPHESDKCGQHHPFPLHSASTQNIMHGTESSILCPRVKKYKGKRITHQRWQHRYGEKVLRGHSPP